VTFLGLQTLEAQLSPQALLSWPLRFTFLVFSSLVGYVIIAMAVQGPSSLSFTLTPACAGSSQLRKTHRAEGCMGYAEVWLTPPFRGRAMSSWAWFQLQLWNSAPCWPVVTPQDNDLYCLESPAPSAPPWDSVLRLTFLYSQTSTLQLPKAQSHPLLHHAENRPNNPQGMIYVIKMYLKHKERKKNQWHIWAHRN
jgi:hypothetical protein